jgi:hypothetical protein
MNTGIYMFIALLAASGSCQESRLIIHKMASLELCQAAVNLTTKAGGLADCVHAPSPNAAPSRAVSHRSHKKRSDSSDEPEAEVQQLNRAQLGDQ